MSTGGTLVIDRNQSPVSQYSQMDYTNFCLGPGYITGNFYMASGIGHMMTATGTAAALTTGTQYFYPFFCMQTQAFSAIAMWVVAGSVATNINMGIYASSGGQPTGNPLPKSTSGSVATTSSGAAVSFTFSSTITLTGNTWYWLSATESSSTPTFTVMGAGNAGNDCSVNGLGEAAIGGADQQITGWTQAFVYGTTLPVVGSLTSITAASVLHGIFLKV